MTLPCLPTELIEQIATYLDLASIRSFRLTSPPLSKQTSHLFRDRFFRKLSIEWTVESLEKLRAISLHETFGDALQDLLIDATPYRSIHLWASRLRISEAHAISTPYGTVSANPEFEKQYRVDVKIAEKEATFLNETRHDRKCLVSCFERVGRLASVSFEYEGVGEECAKFCKRYCERSQHEMSRPFVSTMAAITATKLQVGHICLSKEFPYGAISIGRMESLAPNLRAFDHAFEGLETLQLHLRDWRDAEDGFKIETSRAPFIVRFLAHARNLKSLELSCYSQLESNLFSEMAAHCHFKKLEVCKLSVMQIPTVSSFRAFFAYPSKTLRSLRLDDILLGDPRFGWPELLYGLQDDANVLCRLEDLHIRDLFTADGLRVWIDGRLERCLGQKGQLGSWRNEAVDEYDMRREASWSGGAVTYPFKGLR
jgi:hypothetical protein